MCEFRSTSLGVTSQGAYHHLKRELNLRDAEDNISSEYDVQETLLGRIRRKYREAVKRYALGPEYQGYLEYKAWRQAQGIPIAEASNNLVPVGRAC